MSFKVRLMSGAALFGLALGAHSAIAQEGASDSAPAAARTHGIEDIVVTARKIEERVQDVPVSITAFSADQLAARGIERISDIQYSVPGLVFSQTATSSFSPLVSMRGQTQGTIAISVDPSIGVYVDGVYLSGTAGLMSDTLADIARVEVLKGPQGTLFGRNTTGGAVSLTTQLPTYELEGEVTGGIGNYERRMLREIVNVPIVEDKIALRMVQTNFERDGYGYDTARKVGVGDQDITSLRTTLLLEPNEKLQLVLRGDWTSAQDNGLLTHPLYIVPNTAISIVGDAAIGGFGADTPANRTAGLAAYQNLIGLDPFTVRYNTPVYSAIVTENYSLTATYDFDFAQLKSITANRRTKDRRLYEVDASDLILFTSETTIHLNQFTQELQLTGDTFGDRLTYALGAFYYDLEGDEASEGFQFGNLLNGRFSTTAADVTDESWAIYGQGTFALTDTLNLTLGLRYTDETKSVNALGGTSTNTTPFACSLPAALNPNLITCRAYVETSEDNLSYSATVDWSPVEDVMLYARTARGFKSGTINQRIIGSNPLAGNVVLPETVTDYELGLKSDLLDGRVRANLAAYQSKYENIQRSSVFCNPACSSVLGNAAEATINGVEFEFIAIPFENLELGLSGAYTDPQYDRYVSGGLDNSREKFLEVPELAYTISAGYTIPTSSGDLTAHLDWAWRDETDMAPQDYPGGVAVVGGVPMLTNPGTPDTIRIQEPYGLLNGTLSFDLNQTNATVRIFGANLLDEEYYSHALGNSGALGVAIGSPGAPRTYGVDVTMRF